MTQLTALLSVSDKTGILDFAKGLHALGAKLLSTGGTAKLLAEAGLPVTEVAEHTGFPEMMDGRVKTLHPKIHGGLLARSDLPEHVAAMEKHGITRIDILAVNLYPFEATVAKPGCTLEDAIENIDIGGPAMVRSAAKNWKDVTVLTDAAQYAAVLDELKASGRTSDKTRFACSVAAFNRIAQYDAAISNYLSALQEDGSKAEYPAQMNATFVKVQDLRYGENPHQSAAFYRDIATPAGSLANYRQLQGKELSYNNIADADAAWECVKSFDVPACVIVKHANPCGVAVAANAAEAYGKAFKTDPTSASALKIFKGKANVRLLQIALPQGGTTPWQQGRNAGDSKRVGSGLLLQTADNHFLKREDLKVVTTLQPTAQQLDDLMFAWTVAQHVKSNAIVFCGGGMTLGVGAGQMSRLDSARIASIKAQHAGLSLQGSAVASDAFFPFRDGLDVLADAGATCVIQPGGSMRDDEVIAAADERGIAMVLTGVRHFRH